MLNKNPFNPDLGDVPDIFLDKQKQVDDLIQTIKDNTFVQSFFTGVRTSFLMKIAEQL